jgi:hypothetical protein
MQATGVGYVEAFNAIVRGDDPDEVVKAYQAGGVSAGDLLSRLRSGIERIAGLRGGPSADTLAVEAGRLLEILESLQERDATLLDKTALAVDGLLAAITDEEARRERDKPKMVSATLGGIEVIGEEPPTDRAAAGRRLDALAQGHMRSYGTDYATAFRAVSASHPSLRRCYGGPSA